MAERDAFLVPTLVTYDAMERRGAELGLAPVAQAKNREVLDAGRTAIGLAGEAGVRIGFGTDLMGALDDEQLHGLRLQAEVEGPLALLRRPPRSTRNCWDGTSWAGSSLVRRRPARPGRRSAAGSVGAVGRPGAPGRVPGRRQGGGARRPAGAVTWRLTIATLNTRGIALTGSQLAGRYAVIGAGFDAGDADVACCQEVFTYWHLRLLVRRMRSFRQVSLAPGPSARRAAWSRSPGVR